MDYKKEYLELKKKEITDKQKKNSNWVITIFGSVPIMMVIFAFFGIKGTTFLFITIAIILAVMAGILAYISIDTSIIVSHLRLRELERESR